MRFWKRKCPEEGCTKSFWLTDNYYEHLEAHLKQQQEAYKTLYSVPVQPLQRRQRQEGRHE